MRILEILKNIETDFFWSQKSASIRPRTSRLKWLVLRWEDRKRGQETPGARKEGFAEAELYALAAAGVLEGGCSRHIALSEARSRLCRRRSLPPNSHFAAFSRSTRFSQFCAARISKVSKIWISSKISWFWKEFTEFLQNFKEIENFDKFEISGNFGQHSV